MYCMAENKQGAYGTPIEKINISRPNEKIGEITRPAFHNECVAKYLVCKCERVNASLEIQTVCDIPAVITPRLIL